MILNFSSNQCNANIILNKIPIAVVLDPSVNIKLYSAVSESSIAADTKKYAPIRGAIPNSGTVLISIYCNGLLFLHSFLTLSLT